MGVLLFRRCPLPDQQSRSNLTISPNLERGFPVRRQPPAGLSHIVGVLLFVCRLREREGVADKASSKSSILDRPLKPVAGLDADGLLAMTESSYIEIVQWTGEQARSDKRGQLKPATERKRAAPADIRTVFDHPNDWLRQVRGTESIFYRAIGSADALMEKAEQLGQVWMKGVASEVAKRILRERPT
jgi:hypothetical protein